MIVKGFVERHLGHCARCMRLSFQWAIGFWMAAIVSAFFAPKLIAAMLFASAIAASLLWIAHILVFAAKGVARSARQPDEDRVSLERRSVVIGTFWRATAIAAATSLPLFARPALAQRSTCNCYVCTPYEACCKNSSLPGCDCTYQTNMDCYMCCQ